MVQPGSPCIAYAMRVVPSRELHLLSVTQVGRRHALPEVVPPGAHVTRRKLLVACLKWTKASRVTKPGP